MASLSAWVVALGEESFFPECLGCSARGRGFLPQVFRLRRSGKRVSSPSVWAAALGEEGVFPECCTRRRFFLKKKREGNGVDCSPTTSTVTRVSERLSGKPSSSARFLALGEDVFSVKRYPEHSSLSVALGEGFPECNWAFPECI